VTAAVIQEASALQFAEVPLKRSKSVLLAAAGGDWARLFEGSLAEDREVAWTAVGIDWKAAQYLSPRWDPTQLVSERGIFCRRKNTRKEQHLTTSFCFFDLVWSKKWDHMGPYGTIHGHGRLHDDADFMHRAIGLNGLVIQVVPGLCAQRACGLCAVRQNGLALQFLSEVK